MIDTIASVLISCHTSNYFTYLNMLVASNILYALATWCLLFTAVYTLNTMLAQSHNDHLAGQKISPVYKIVPLAIVAVMFLLICGSTGLWSYNTVTRGLGSVGARGPANEASQKLKLAMRILYLVGVCAGAVLAGLSVMKMRAMRVAGGVSSFSSSSLTCLSTRIIFLFLANFFFLFRDSSAGLAYSSFPCSSGISYRSQGQSIAPRGAGRRRRHCRIFRALSRLWLLSL